MAVNLRKKYTGNPNLKKRKRSYKFQLDYIHNGKRIRETIKEVIINPSDTKEQKEQKKRIVDKIKADLEIQIANNSIGIISRDLKKASFLLYFENLAKKKNPNTKVAWDNTLNHIIEFHGRKLKFENITESWLENFRDYLLQIVAINSARTYLQKVSTALNQAVKQKIIPFNPYKYIDKPKKEDTQMVYLNIEEIQEIMNTKFFNDEVKNAFLFGCYTGLRFSDIKKLKWNNIEDKNIRLTQTKTKGTVSIPLNNNAEQILKKQMSNNELVFNLSNHSSSINKTLRKLIKRTSIKKHVTFHASRHTFATLLVSNGTNIYTISKLLGHKDIKSTLVYAEVIDEEKVKAVNSIPNFKF